MRLTIVAALLLVALPWCDASAQQTGVSRSSPRLPSAFAPFDARSTRTTLLEQAVSRTRFEAALERPDDQGQPPSPRRQRGRISRAVWTAAGAFGGMVAGAYIGVKLEGDCHCDDPGLQGVVIGVPIGMIGGGLLAHWLAH